MLLQTQQRTLVAISHYNYDSRPSQSTSQCAKRHSFGCDLSKREFCGAVLGVDEVVHNITEALKQYDLYNNSVIVFVSDNGGSTKFGGNNFPLRGAKSTLYEGGNRVPGFIHSPLLKKTGYTYSGLFHIVDWYTTFLHLAGIEPDKNANLNGFNQWESVSEGKPSPRTEFPYLMDTYEGTKIGAVRVGDYKLIDGPGGISDSWITENETEGFDGAFIMNQERWKLLFNLTDLSPKLFNLAMDPTEKHNLADEEPEKLAEMRKRFDYYFKMAKPAVKLVGDPKADPANFGGVYIPGWCKAYDDVPKTHGDTYYNTV
uniref:Sulfatase N-terminal domain-containing protein n=1 Tax=Strigamia maritima TaxID=126957 RepID=T1IKA2_STRMM